MFKKMSEKAVRVKNESWRNISALEKKSERILKY